MNWSEIPAASPVSFSGLLSFMERWKPGSTRGFRPASTAQIGALGAFHGGRDVLPRVYREFLSVMGDSTGEWRLTRGTTSISALLEDLEDRDHERPDLQRYLKFAVGEDDYNGRQPDDFFDLARPTSDGADADILRIHEERLKHGDAEAERPFSTFSDLLRTLVVVKIAFQIRDKSPRYFDLGRRLKVIERAYELLLRLGFETTELGISLSSIPLENPRRGAIALLLGPTDLDGCLRLRAQDDDEERRLMEIVADHRAELVKP